jgi:hypothetical protein
MQNVQIIATLEDRDGENSEWLKVRPIKLSWETGDSKRAMILTVEDAENLFLSLAGALGIELEIERNGEELPTD